uniref:Uncharacterized protein n=1 Tax=Anguilla anguilla TaxID=7936 RepID=A0A0E9WVG7_ANGAN
MWFSFMHNMTLVINKPSCYVLYNNKYIHYLFFIVTIGQIQTNDSHLLSLSKKCWVF